MDRETAALLERAAAFRRAGRVDEAIGAYRAVLDREPDLPDSWYNLGWLQRRARQYEAALDSYGEALRRGVRDPQEVHLNRAVILSDQLARHDEAETELQAALKLRPDYVPALLNLGNLHEDRGDRAAAQAAYRRALDAAPGDPLALSRLAGVVDAHTDAAAELIERLQEAASREPDPSGRADLGFALGRLLDARGAYAEAFAAYEAANRSSRESFGPAFRDYDRESHERFIDRLIAAFPKPARHSDQSAPATFIVGMFRSGSTLIEQILASHGRIVSGGELDLIPELVSRIPGYPEAVAAANELTVERWRSFYRDGLEPFASPGSIVTDKRPDNFLHVGLIKTLFPAAKIVHTRRNRLDNLLSLHFLHLGPAMPYALDLADAAHWHAQSERLMAHWKRLYPDDIFDVDYDSLVLDPKPILDRLLAFLDLEWEDELLDFHRRSGAVKTASVWQVREPLHTRSTERWRNYQPALKGALGDLSGD
jgi:tetratricopeptide (TPR) repeat protein